MQIICRCTGRPRSTPARASSWIAPRWRTGSVTPRGTCGRCTNACSSSSGRDQSCSPTRPRCRCSIPAAGAPRPASSGPMPPTTGHGAAPIRPASPMSTDRKAERPIAHLAGFKGILQVDGYAGYPKLAERGDVELAFCWAHMRRNFYDLATPGPAPIASEALKRIAEFYAIEKDIRGRSAEERHLIRQQKSRPLADTFEQWLHAKLALISQKGKLPDAVRYALTRWRGLTRFIDDGCIEIDNNTVERSIRPIKLNRKNALFAGSDGGAEHWAVIASLIETCQPNDVDPLNYLTDVLSRIVNGHPNSEIDQLLPWAYRRQELKAVAWGRRLRGAGR